MSEISQIGSALKDGLFFSSVVIPATGLYMAYNAINHIQIGERSVNELKQAIHDARVDNTLLTRHPTMNAADRASIKSRTRNKISVTDRNMDMLDKRFDLNINKKEFYCKQHMKFFTGMAITGIWAKCVHYFFTNK